MDDGTYAEVLDPATVSPDRMREVLGHFASGVVVITAIDTAGPTGFTCQSFASLSLDPPLVSFAPSRASLTWPKIRQVGRFCVNVLAEGHEDVSNRFARSGTDKFVGVRWHRSRSGLPVLDEVCAWIECTLHNEFDGGDHTIAVGRVHGLAAGTTPRPLLFHRGGYGIDGSAS